MTATMSPHLVVDGPLPVARPYNLVKAATVLPEADGHWAGGVDIRPYATGAPGTFASCIPETSSPPMSKPVDRVPGPQEFGPFAVVRGDECTGGPGYQEMVDRSRVAFEATETATVEAVFLNGGPSPDTIPHLGGEATTPDGVSSFRLDEAIAILENRIAADIASGGMIHMDPGMASSAKARNIISDQNGQLRTANGTLVVAGAGYVDGALDDDDAPSQGQGWIWATGPVEIRRSDIFSVTDSASQALDRSNNDLTVYNERFYVIDWDTAFTRAVLADRSA